MQKHDKFPRANKEILSQQVRLINDEGTMLGVLNIQDALNKARDKGLDLVEVSPNANPPVCKLLNFGKYKYEIQKKNHEARKKQKIIEVKEIKIRPNIGEHDYNIKLKAIFKFLNQGDKVKISIRFRGREFYKQEFAMNIMKNIQESTAEIAKIELEPKMEARQLLMVLVPNK